MAFITNEDVKIHYEVEGKGPALVLHHGFYGSIEDWYEFGYVDAFKESYQLILIDSRGHGKSDKPHVSDQYSQYRRALDVIKVLDAEGITKCNYVGFSMGGWISFGLMRYFMERFNSFTIIGMCPYANDMSSSREYVKTLDTWVPLEDMSEATKARYLSNDKEALMAAVTEKREDQSDVLANISVPCLMMAGEKDDVYPFAKESAGLSNMIKFITIPGVDHGNSLYKSHLTIPHIKDFISKL